MVNLSLATYNSYGTYSQFGKIMKPVIPVFDNVNAILCKDEQFDYMDL